MNNWSDEETDDPVYADRRNFYKVEKWSRDGLRGFAGLINVLPSRREDDPARTASAPTEAVFLRPSWRRISADLNRRPTRSVRHPSNEAPAAHPVDHPATDAGVGRFSFQLKKCLEELNHNHLTTRLGGRTRSHRGKL